jgi:hypothetical protein
VLGVLPTKGPVFGKTTVTVTGNHFLRGLRCDFGGLRVEAQVRSASQASCESPPHHNAQVSLSVTNNNIELSDMTGGFEYVDPIGVLELSPRIGSSRGGTLVSVRLDVRQQSLYTSCSFGAQVVPASQLTSSILQCVSPAHAVGAPARGDEVDVRVKLRHLHPRLGTVRGTVPVSGCYAWNPEGARQRLPTTVCTPRPPARAAAR